MVDEPQELAIDPALLGQALRRERWVNGRRMAGLRLVLVCAFFVHSMVYILWGQETFDAGMSVFLVYLLLAALLGAWARRSERGAVTSLMAIPILDVPIVLAMHLCGIYFGDDVPATTGSMSDQPMFIGLIVAMLIGIATSALRGWLLVATAAVSLASLWLLGLLYQSHVQLLTFLSLVVVSLMLIGLYLQSRMMRLMGSVVSQQMQRQRLRRFFSPEVVALLETGDRVDRPTVRTITILFVDVRGFTAMTQRLPGERVVELLNGFHAAMVEPLFRHGGTLDKFLGDGLMAYFNAPLDQPDHAERALRCASDMIRALRELNEERQQRGEPPLRMGIGIHSGEATLGQIGSAQRREYTAIGPAVNLADRVQRLTREVDCDVLMTDATRCLLDPAGGADRLDPLPPARVRGFDEPISVYRLSAR